MQTQKLNTRCAHVAAAALAVAAALVLTGCVQATAAVEQPLTRSELAAQQACPKGYTVEWTSSTEMQCLKEL